MFDLRISQNQANKHMILSWGNIGRSMTITILPCEIALGIDMDYFG